MGRRRTRLPWRYDENRQEFHTPSGRIVTLSSIATMLDDQLHNRYDFSGPWAGWRMRGNRLSPPRCGSAALKPDTGQAFLRWIEAATPYTSASDAVRDLIDKIKASA